ncbi:MAG TPA: hypothetical protein VHT70_05460 [Candidatus Saccharimonadales bacterium]|jgi:hypothetical protein|nr:hypothetical protein [Candidatus Saccharimonadales bacterium]
MSGTSVTGHVLGAATTVGSAAALPTITGHRDVAIYAVLIALLCIAAVVLSKVFKQVLMRRYDS